MFFEQIKHQGDNFSYIIADDLTGKAVVVDPSFNADVIIRRLRDQVMNAEYIIDTHHHGDHTAGNERIKSSFAAKVVAHELSEITKDVSVVDGESINAGKVTIKVIHTPGHTPDSICLLTDNKLLTGDTLFVGECGRTDLPDGSAKDIYYSLFHKLMKLDDNIEIYPGHDYGPSPYSTIGMERRTNYTLEKRTLAEFVEFMETP